MCDRAIQYKKSTKEHVCPKNHVTAGRSKAIEPDASVEMMIDAVMKYNVIYSTVICDDDSTIRAVSQWSYKELLKLQPSFQWPRTLKGLKKSDKGCLLPLTVPEPKFLSDPSHRIWVLLCPAFLKSNGRVSLERPSKADCLRLKIDYGAWIKKSEPLSDRIYYLLQGANQPFICLAPMITALRHHGALQNQEKWLVTENITTRKRKNHYTNG